MGIPPQNSPSSNIHQKEFSTIPANEIIFDWIQLRQGLARLEIDQLPWGIMINSESVHWGFQTLKCFGWVPQLGYLRRLDCPKHPKPAASWVFHGFLVVSLFLSHSFSGSTRSLSSAKRRLWSQEFLQESHWAHLGSTAEGPWNRQPGCRMQDKQVFQVAGSCEPSTLRHTETYCYSICKSLSSKTGSVTYRSKRHGRSWHRQCQIPWLHHAAKKLTSNAK